MRLAFQDDEGVESVLELVKRASYGQQQACTVMLLVAHEVDAMASAKMLTRILMFHNIAYTIKPVANLEQINRSFGEINDSDSIKTVFMLNCGATMNIQETLNPGANDKRCIIIDSHRPIHVTNIHSPHNIVIFDDENVMSQEEVPEDDSDLENELKKIDNKRRRREGIKDGYHFDDDDDDDDDDSTDDSTDDDMSDEEENDNSDEEEENDNNSDEEKEIGDIEDDLLNHAEDNYINDHGNVTGSGGTEREPTSPSVVDTSHEDEADENDHGHERESMNEEEDRGSVNEEEDRGSVNDEEDRGSVNDEEDRGSVNDEEDRGSMNDEEEDDEHIVTRKRRKPIDPIKLKRQKMLRYIKMRPRIASVPSSYAIMHFLGASQMGKSHEFYWQAIIGITDQFLRKNLDDDHYNKCCDLIRKEMATMFDIQASKYKVPRRADADDESQITVQGSEAGRIESKLEYRFFMYRHCSLYEAMYYSEYIAAKMRPWNQHTRLRLQEMLAKLGMPLNECHQHYSFMSPVFKEELRRQLSKVDPDDPEAIVVKTPYKLENPNVMIDSFIRYNSFRNEVAAMDVVHAASALVEMCKHDGFGENEKLVSNRLTMTESHMKGVFSGMANNSQLDAFNAAYDCLSMKDDVLKNGIRAALALQKIVVRQAEAMLDNPKDLVNHKFFRVSKIRKRPGGTGYGWTSASGSSGPSSSIAVDDENDIEDPLGRTMVLSRLGHFVQQVCGEMGRWKGSDNKAALPLIIASERAHTNIIIAIPAPRKYWGNTDPNFNFEESIRRAIYEVDDADEILEARPPRCRLDGLDSTVFEVSKRIKIDRIIRAIEK